MRAISLEHKMGLHGSPTCVMEFDGAKGWLIGEAHQGLAGMFTMMNNARLGVGVQGLSQADAALQAATAFARERRQGRSPVEGEPAIIGHADVRRMLVTMAATVAVARAICLDCALSTDLGIATGEEEWAARAAFLTPIAKAFGTDAGCEVSAMAMQVFGGMGYVEETGVAQFYRDVRVTAIYEGTNGIQAMDMVGRKLADGGAVAQKLIEAVEETARQAAGDLGARLAAAARRLAEATGWMASAEMNDRFAGAVPYLRAFALTLGGHYLLKAAAAEGVEDGPRAAMAAFHIRQLLPQAIALCDAACEGAAPLYAIELGP